MNGTVSLAAAVGIALIALLAGFALCYLWMRSREVRLVSSQAELLSAKAEELARLKRDHERAIDERDARLSEREADLAALEERAGAQDERIHALEEELARTRVTVGLERFSDFQILGMCDVFDAEQREGALRRAYGDPAMEQLMNLGIVDFEMPHDGGRDRTPLWTLKPEWRAAVSACRTEMDARTEELRARREAKQAELSA